MEEIDQNSLESLKLFVQVFITMKMTQNDSPHIKILENHILKIFLYACYNGNTKVLKCLLDNNIIKTSISREIVLNGICTCLHVKDIVHFSNFIYLLDAFNVTIGEVNGTRHNLMKYCVLVDNVDAFILLESKYKLNLKQSNRLQKDILVSTGLHNVSRRTIDYMFSTKIIDSVYLKQFPEDLIGNTIFKDELINKYGYKQTIFKPPSGKYIPPQMRKKMKTTYDIFNSRSYNRADKDFNWRRKEIQSKG
jgi:hypothetical protein